MIRSLVICILLLASAASAGEGNRSPRFVDAVKTNLVGWTVWVDPSLLKGTHQDLGAKAMKSLETRLEMLIYVVPEARLADLRKIAIRLDRNMDGLNGMQYHPSEGWLKSNGFDPKLVKQVHIPQARALIDREQWHKHPWVILHELAHGYHDQVLGFDHKDVKAAYDRVKEAGIYDQVLLYSGQTVKHYAMTDHKEFFAELTESYLVRNDFYPFVRAELKEHDPETHALMKSIWENK